jgi:hypothetical protein
MKKPKLVKTALDGIIMELVGKTDKKTLVIWACDCAERVLPYFEKKYPGDKRPRLAIEAGRAWVRTGVFRMADIRRASLTAHAAAREVREDEPAHSAARAAGQAVAAAHVSSHSIAAAIYATTAIRDLGKGTEADAATMKERNWQHQHLLDLIDRR